MTIKRMQQRHDTAANWTAANPVLFVGELGYETDTGKFKFGDGITAWNSLSYDAASSVAWSDVSARPAPLIAGGNAPNGYPILDGGGKVGANQLTITAMEYKGVWNATTNSPTLADGTGNQGDLYRVSPGGTQNLGSGSIVFVASDYIIYNGTTWEKSDTTDAVSSVAGLVGAVGASALTDALTDGSVNKVLTAADKTRLATTSGTNTGDQTSVSGNAGTATKWATARLLDGQSVDGTGDVPIVAPGTHAATSKTTPVDADEIPLADSAATFGLKKLTWASLKAAVKTYYDAVVTAPTNKDLTSVTNTFPAFTDSGAIPKSLVDAKGDLLTATADNTPARLAVGANRSFLKASSSTTSGLRYAADRVFNITDPEYGAIGDGDAAKAAANTTALQNAINDAFTAGGGFVYVPASVGAYCFNGVVIPTAGYVFLVGDGPGLSTGTGAVTGSVLRNVHATNPSVKVWSSVPDDGSTNRFWGIYNIGFDASAINTGQAALDLNWAVRWDVDNVRVSYMDIGVKCRLSWGGSFRNLAIDHCTTGQDVVADVNGTSCPVVWDNLTIYNCTTGILSTNGLSGASFFGGTIGNCVTGVNLVGFVNIQIAFFGMFFEANTGDDIIIGISGTSGGKGILFSNCAFQPHVAKARSVLFAQGTTVTFDTCVWCAPFDAGVVTNGIVMFAGAGVLTLVNPRFENTTNHITRGGIVHPVPPGTGLFTVYGFGAPAATVSRIGNGVSTVPQVTTPTSSATPAINVDTCDMASITALAANITSMSSGLTGTPYNGQQLRIRIKDNGTARTIVWGASFTGPLPTTTVASTPLNVTVIYDSVLAQWVYTADVLSIVDQAANYTLLAGDFVKSDASGGALAHTLPTAPKHGTRVGGKKTDASTNNVVFTTGGSDKINTTAGGTTITLSKQNQAFIAQYDNADATWVITSTDVPLSQLLLVSNNLSDVASAATARTNLGLAIGTDVQAWNTNLDTWATKTSAATATASTVAARDANANLLADAFIPSSTSTATAAGTTVLTTDSTEVQFFTGATTQTVTLPTTGVVAGHRFTVVNLSSGTVTVQSSGANTVFAVPAGVSTIFLANTTTPTTAAHWTFYVQQTSYASTLATNNTIASHNAQGNLLADVFIAGFASVPTAAGTTTFTVDSVGIVNFTGATTQTATLPTTSVTAGHTYRIINTSSGTVTINSSGGNLVKSLLTNTATEVTALVATPTTAAHWFAS